ncbi:MAG: hypothetical protein AAGJ87_15755, partial [Pseudomonadota bacterium]
MIGREKRVAWMQRWRDLRARPAVARTLKAVQYALLAGVVAYLLYRFTSVGWGEVFSALPTSPWFYAFFLMRFLALPISELAIYEMIWGRPLLRHFPAFVRKRVYNFAVMGYSGEGFLTLWAQRTLPLSQKSVMVGVKDNNLLSALASNGATVVLILALAANGGLSAGFAALPPGAGVLFALAFTSALVLAVTVLAFRNRLISLSPLKMRRLMSVHAVRISLILALHAAMYAAALPGASLSAWVMFLALQLVLSRIPFIP